MGVGFEFFVAVTVQMHIPGHQRLLLKSNEFLHSTVELTTLSSIGTRKEVDLFLFWLLPLLPPLVNISTEMLTLFCDFLHIGPSME